MPYDRSTVYTHIGFDSRDIISRLEAIKDCNVTLTDIARTITNEYKKPEATNVLQRIETALAQTDAISARNRARSIKAYIIDIEDKGEYDEALETIFRATLGKHCLPEPNQVLEDLLTILKNEA